MKKVKVQAQVRVNAYPLIADAVADGVAYGWNRAHKHTDAPSADHIKEQIEQAVLNELCEILNFDP